jgi:hypothetical protein
VTRAGSRRAGSEESGQRGERGVRSEEMRMRIRMRMSMGMIEIRTGSERRQGRRGEMHVVAD